jgi:hypothetical protein
MGWRACESLILGHPMVKALLFVDFQAARSEDAVCRGSRADLEPFAGEL